MQLKSPYRRAASGSARRSRLHAIWVQQYRAKRRLYWFRTHVGNYHPRTVAVDHRTARWLDLCSRAYYTGIRLQRTQRPRVRQRVP